MTFSSIEFIIFFSIIILLMSITKLKFLTSRFESVVLMKYRHIVLLISSYVFYGWWDARFCFLMLLLTYIAYISAKNIDNKIYEKFYKCVGIVFPLIILMIFKYFNFFIDSFALMFGLSKPGTLNIILPVGISFYTFQSMSYTIDVIRKEIKSENFLNTALYVSFFPQLVAGPIVKAADFIPQLYEERNVSFENFKTGIQIFVFGLFKKIVLADHLSVFVDDVFSKPAAFHSISVILAVISYSIQIYLDFSGYSDMAIGSAKCLGYDFQRNFNMPYISKNVSEFWKRWHISLSSWLQSYLYIPLGGNRNGKVRTYINLMITMVLGGLWHGASWNFVLWGALHGLALAIHKIYKSKVRLNNKLYNVISVAITYIFVCICWVFFRSSDLDTSLCVLNKLFIWSDGIVQIYSWSLISALLVIISSVAAVIHSKRLGLKKTEGYYVIMNLNKFIPLVILFTTVGLIFALMYTGGNPFIYFQF